MYRYTRYIIAHLLGPTLFITLSLTAIVWLAQSLRFVDLIVNRGLSVSTFLYLTVLLIPSVLTVVLPVAAVASTFFIYQKLTADSELVVLRSVGLSQLQLAKPVLIFSGMLCVFGYVNSLYLQPFSFREFKDLQFFIRNNYASLILQEGVFSTPMDGLTVFVRQREESGGFSDILVHDARGKVPSTMLAQYGQLVKTENGPRFLLEKGLRQSVNPEKKELSFLQFDSYALDISLYTETKTFRLREPKERYFHELLTAEPEASEAFQRELVAETHNRLTWPLIIIALPMIAAASMLTGSFNRRGQWKRIVAGALITAVLLGLGVSLTGLVARYGWLAIFMYSLSPAAVGLSLLAMNRHEPLWITRRLQRLFLRLRRGV